MDAITLLKKDHQTVEKLFKRFEKTGDGALVERRKIVDQIIEELAKHAAIEEQLFYPVTRATVDEVDDVVLESLEEHHVVKWLLSELETMDPADERFKAKTTVLIENVRHHVKEPRASPRPGSTPWTWPLRSVPRRRRPSASGTPPGSPGGPSRTRWAKPGSPQPDPSCSRSKPPTARRGRSANRPKRSPPSPVPPWICAPLPASGARPTAPRCRVPVLTRTTCCA